MLNIQLFLLIKLIIHDEALKVHYQYCTNIHQFNHLKFCIVDSQLRYEVLAVYLIPTYPLCLLGL